MENTQKVRPDEFMAARLDEDERYLQSNRHHLWTQRPLRQVEAGRALLRAYDEACKFHQPYPDDSDTGYRDGLRVAIEIAASIWNDHPDYDPGWKP